MKFYFNGTTGNGNGQGTWDFGDGVNASFLADPNPSHHYQNPGNYTVSLSYQDWDGDAVTITREYYIHIQTDLVPDFTILINPEIIVEGGLKNNWSHFSASGSFGNLPVTFRWQFPYWGEWFLPEFDIYFPFHGIFLINLTIRDIDGDSVTIRKNITILQNILPVLSFAPDDTDITVGESVRFIFTGILGNEPVQRVFWTFGDRTAGSTELNPSHVFLKEGVYNITLFIIDYNGDNATLTLPVVITIMPPEPPPVIDPTIFIITGSTIAGVTIVASMKSMIRKRRSNVSWHP
ncbi:MAG: PKD domain-containing protein [Candidatus Sigynarchaeum springense]